VEMALEGIDCGDGDVDLGVAGVTSLKKGN